MMRTRLAARIACSAEKYSKKTGRGCRVLLCSTQARFHLHDRLDQDMETAFSTADTSILKDRLAEVKILCTGQPGSIRVVDVFEAILTKVRKQFLRAPSLMNNHPLAQVVHATVKDAVTLNQWTPTKKFCYQTLMQIAPDPETTEEWLRLQQRNSTSPVDRHDYTTVIQSWARSDHPQAAEKAEQLIKELREQFEVTERNEICFKPTEAAYVGWITCLTKSRDKIAGAIRAERVLEEIKERAEQDNFQPTIKIYNAVMNAWAKAGQPQNAGAMLRDLCDKAFDKGSCIPDQISFTTVIDAWSKSDRPEAPDRAEDILVLLRQFSGFSFQQTARPNAITLTAVMNCWAKSSRNEAPDRAEMILRQMLRSFAAGKAEMRPNLISFNTCMNAWARSGTASAPEQVEGLFQELVQFGLAPDAVSFMARINVWERARRRDDIECAENAFQALEDMRALGLIPSVLHYNRVLFALGRCSDGHRAQTLLDQMLEHLRPTTFSFHCVMSAWAKQCSVEGAAQCERILSIMDEPELVSFNTAIGAWAKSRSTRGLDNAESLLRKMIESGIKPDSYTLSPMFRLLADAPLPPGEKLEKAELLLKMAKDNQVAMNDAIWQSAAQCGVSLR
jgi:Pentatricopeptide repeat domain/PPR repeat